MDETNEIPVIEIEDSATRSIAVEGGQIDLTIYSWSNGVYTIDILGNGTSSCVDRIVTHNEGDCVSVTWNGKTYEYQVENINSVLAEFMMTLSLGKVGNYVKQNNIMPASLQEALANA